MADWPADGDTDWNTKMKANIDVGHDSDGTHKKSQMLTDMEWSPTAYAAEESVTLPNGTIMKFGVTTLAAGWGEKTVTYGTAFPNGIITVIASLGSSAGAQDRNNHSNAYDLTVTTFKSYGNGGNINWMAIGY